jgi:hypothetical protein
MSEEEPRLPSRPKQLIDAFVAWTGLAAKPRRYFRIASVGVAVIAVIAVISYLTDGCEKMAVIARTPVPVGAITQTGAPAPAGSDCGSTIRPGLRAGYVCAERAACHWGTPCVTQYDTESSMCDCIGPRSTEPVASE